jgi:superfamily II DNA or RNA helicase
MSVEGVVRSAQQSLSVSGWSAAVRLVRQGAVRAQAIDGDEIEIIVRTRDIGGAREVSLFVEDEEWGCDCETRGDCCVHVAAAAIWYANRPEHALAIPKKEKTMHVRVEYALSVTKSTIKAARYVCYANGVRSLLNQSLAKKRLTATSADAAIERILLHSKNGFLSGPEARTFLSLLPNGTNVSLDGEEISVNSNPLFFVLRVTDLAEDFKIGLYRPPGIERLMRGAAVKDGELRPTSAGTLSADEQRTYTIGKRVMASAVGGLVREMIPALEKKIPLEVISTRLPSVAILTPTVQIALSQSDRGLNIAANIVYGEPPIAIVKGSTVQALGSVVVTRDLARERLIKREFHDDTGLHVGASLHLDPSEAARFLALGLRKFKGQVVGEVDVGDFELSDEPLVPRLEVSSADNGYYFDAIFEHEGRALETKSVLSAWEKKASVVPLMSGGFAPLPLDWLEKHGSIVAELLDSRTAEGTIDLHATAALVDLIDDVEGQAPEALTRLHSWLESGDDLEPSEPHPGLQATLRPYQEVGRRWLEFLRSTGLHGILADDMGLGKTVQALAALLETDGQSLVVAPTSVIPGWAFEAGRFSPELKVNLYHGPNRKLDPSADITVTSYALLRLDIEKLSQIEWTYAILDEAQAIKNPVSLTARSARRLQAKHRLALTGTPVENRLDELWSIFRFLAPGLLGSRRSFRDQFSNRIVEGDMDAAVRLRKRVKPYLLRRIKSEVATDLPSLTDVVIRCSMGEEQRALYDAVRAAARADVLRALGAGNVFKPLAVLEALLRLRQACCDPALLPIALADQAPSAKLDKLEEMLIDLLVDDHRVLIFSQWTGLLDRVELRLESLGIKWLRLDGSTRNRGALVDKFQSGDSAPVFLISLKAGGTGLNLTAADYVIHLDPWWNPAVQQQATDRAHRIGQTRPVVSLRFIAEDTVEERVLQMQEHKRGLADAVVGTDAGFLQSMSGDELRALFHDVI